jgi:hypothetical protein
MFAVEGFVEQPSIAQKMTIPHVSTNKVIAPARMPLMEDVNLPLRRV